MNTGPQRNLMTLIASSFFAGMIIGTASAHPPRETVNDKKPTLEAKTKTSKGVLEDTDSDVPASDDLNPLKQEHPSYLADYAYSEGVPDKKPANIVLNSLKDIPVGTPIEEIKRASDAFGLNFNFMRAVVHCRCPLRASFANPLSLAGATELYLWEKRWPTANEIAER